MTTGTDQTAGQLDEATVLRVLEMIHEYSAENLSEAQLLDDLGRRSRAAAASSRSDAALALSDRLVALHRASLGLEEA